MTDSDSGIIGIVTIPDVTNYSPERINRSIGRILQQDYEVDFVGAERASDLIRSHFDLYSYYTRSRSNDLLRKLLLVPLTVLTVVRYVFERDPDVLVSFGNLGINGLICTLVSRVTAITSVVRVTSDLHEIWRYQATWRGKLSIFVRNNVLGHLAVRFADHVITLGPRMQRKLIDRGISADKIHIAPQPPQVETIDREAEIDLRVEYSIPDDADIVLFVGYFKQSKGPKRLVRTIEYVLERDDDVHFVVAGSGGSYDDYVRSTLAEYDAVHMTGWIDHDDLYDYYTQADIFLQTSNTEGLPNVVLEGLYYGVPVVATDSGGEVIEYVTNIGDEYEELGQFIINRHERVVLDELPEMATPEGNERRYQTLFACIIDAH
jgi:glycosyltransferase involved in cell wall biosynthesis